jgi:hypothetical protein
VSVYEGACHCGAVTVRFDTDIAPEAIDVRADQCGFCRRHGVKTVSDPDGRLWLGFREGGVQRYRFGTRSSDCIICRKCGVFIAALIEGYGVLNVVGAGIAPFAERPARVVDYEGETPESRTERRRQRWTPVVCEVAA